MCIPKDVETQKGICTNTIFCNRPQIWALYFLFQFRECIEIQYDIGSDFLIQMGTVDLFQQIFIYNFNLEKFDLLFVVIALKQKYLCFKILRLVLFFQK